MENSAEIQVELEKRYRITAFIVAGQIALTIVFIIAAFLIAPSYQNSVSSNDLTPVWVGALFIAVGIFFIGIIRA